MTTTARMMFITGPMMRIWNRSHFVFDRNSSGLAGSRIVGVLARHLHVAAERNGADAVFRVAAAHLQQFWTEPERKREYTYTEPTCRQEMTKLVHEHEHAENEQEGKKRVH